MKPLQISPTSFQIISPRQLSEASGLSLPTLWRMRRRGEIPEPIRLSPGRVGWRAEVVEAWLTQRAAAGTR